MGVGVGSGVAVACGVGSGVGVGVCVGVGVGAGLDVGAGVATGVGVGFGVDVGVGDGLAVAEGVDEVALGMRVGLGSCVVAAAAEAGVDSAVGDGGVPVSVVHPRATATANTSSALTVGRMAVSLPTTAARG